jgi:transposase InsO family protein
MLRRRGPPSQTWRTFLRNHAATTAATDMFVVPTISFRLLYAMVVIDLGRRELIRVAVTAHPSCEWATRQITEACPWDRAPRDLIRDRDAVYGRAFVRRVRAMGIRDRPVAPRSPWQNGHAERLIGSIRRECLDHVVVWNEDHLRHVLDEYANYYNRTRTHLALSKDAPLRRAVERVGALVSLPLLGGLHHRYARV